MYGGAIGIVYKCADVLSLQGLPSHARSLHVLRSLSPRRRNARLFRTVVQERETIKVSEDCFVIVVNGIVGSKEYWIISMKSADVFDWEQLLRTPYITCLPR